MSDLYRVVRSAMRRAAALKGRGRSREESLTLRSERREIMAGARSEAGLRMKRGRRGKRRSRR